MIAETVASGRLICIMENEGSIGILLTREEALELLDKLPGLINEMPVQLVPEKGN